MPTNPLVRPRTLRSARLPMLAAVGTLVIAARVVIAAEAAPTPATPQSSTHLTAAEAVAAAAKAGERPAPTPAPEHEWLVDDKGHRYYLESYSKSQPFLRIDDKHVRTVVGIPLLVDHEDDKNIYFRVYEVDATKSGPGMPSRPVVTDAMRESYEVTTPTTDRLAFVGFDDGLPRAGQWRNNFAVADMNGDGKLDIVHGPPRKSAGGGPVVFLGDGQGHWQRWNATFPPFQYDYGAAAVADLDHDGRADIVLGSHLHGLVALVQKKPGVFALWNRGLPYRTRADEPLAFSSRAIAIVDWNRDGRPDVAALGEGPQLQIEHDRTTGMATARGLDVFLNQGDGSWKEVVASESSGGMFGDHLIALDVDDDRSPDLLTGSQMEGRKDLLVLSQKTGTGRAVELPVRKAYTPSIAAADFDGDHRIDVAASFVSSELGEWRSGVDVFFGEKGDTWRRELVWVETGHQGVSALAAGDLDGDGNRDLVGLTDDGRVLIFLGDGKGHFALQKNELTKVALACRGSDVHLVDLDGDGRPEIVAEFAGEPAGLPGLYEEPGCPGGGSIRAWKVAGHKGG